MHIFHPLCAWLIGVAFFDVEIFCHLPPDTHKEDLYNVCISTNYFFNEWKITSTGTSVILISLHYKVAEIISDKREMICIKPRYNNITQFIKFCFIPVLIQYFNINMWT